MSEKPSRESFIGATGQPGELRRVTAAEMRRNLDVFRPPSADLSGTRQRPTLSGPSSGCPFLLDARSSPPFQGLDLDPERVQTKGCTFCLDNFGAYVVAKEQDVVATWLEGLRRIRAARPDAREVVLTDERPHRSLPLFFEAIANEPGLGPVELLWKSRADWLLEFAADVERACALAERSNSVAHLYLCGFENFDRAHLELFNKGHGPEVNEAAVAKMRELQARFPRSFEHTKYRSHGIVLFTPWTEPEALIENARWMRRLRFHELRAEAVKTRLRLYPRVPLHRLAERDGLLTERFAEGRGDRAAEQGYDASVPWRFRDARTEAVFQLANALHESDRTITDADLIEVAARFVLRWPGLAAVPGLAHLPVRAAIEAWGAPLSFLLEALGPAAAAFDPEIEAIGKSEKRAALKESVRGSDAEEMARAYRAMGFAAEVAVRHTMTKTTGAHEAGDDHAIIAVAADEAALAEVLAAQRALAGTKESAEQASAVRALGALMGYPPCCAGAFARLEDRGDNLENERFPFTQKPEEALHPWLHRTGSVRLIAHHVCSPGCEASVLRADRVVALLGTADPEAPLRLLETMRVPSLFLDYERFASLHGAWEGDAFRGVRVVPTGRARELEAWLAETALVQLSNDAVTLVARTGEERTLRATRPLLVVPGEPLHASARAALKRTDRLSKRAFSITGAGLAPAAASLRVRSAQTAPALPTGSAPAASAVVASALSAGSAVAASALSAGSAPHASALSAGSAVAASALSACSAVVAPALPAVLRPGLRVASYAIASIERAGSGHTVWLVRDRERLGVHLRAHREGEAYTLRKGRWAVDVEDAQKLGDPARAAIGLLVRALPS